MAEHLLYGKSVKDFGAVGDGCTDDTAAFSAAFNSGEEYISIPFGTYRLTETLSLHDDFVIDCHKRATINAVAFYGKNARNIKISGGVWNGNAENDFLKFEHADHVVLEHVTLHGAANILTLDNVENVTLDSVSFDGAHTGVAIAMQKRVKNITLDTVSFSDCFESISVKNAAVSHLYGHSLRTDGVSIWFISENAELCDMKISHVSGHCQDAVLKMTSSTLKSMMLAHVSVHDGYVQLANNVYDGFEVLDFRRSEELETCFTKPTVTIGGKATVAFHGASLDALILSKKMCPHIQSTPARIVSAVQAARKYLFIAQVTEKDTFLLPCGGFDLLTIK